MSFDSDLNDAFLHSAAYAVLFFLFRNLSLSSHEIKKDNYLCLLSPPPWLLYSVREWSPLYLRKGFDNITAAAFPPVSVLERTAAMENRLSEIDWAQLVQIPSVSESFMQGLAYNLPIRRMDVKDGLIEGGTEEVGGDD